MNDASKELPFDLLVVYIIIGVLFIICITNAKPLFFCSLKEQMQSPSSGIYNELECN